MGHVPVSPKPFVSLGQSLQQHTALQSSPAYEKKGGEETCEFKQCDLVIECDLSTIQELIFSSSKKLCREFYLTNLSKPDFATETGVTAH